jgi:hypothetical protein
VPNPTIAPACNGRFVPDRREYYEQWLDRAVFLPLVDEDPEMWLRKAHEESRLNAAMVVAAVPVRPRMAWWFEFSRKTSEIRYPYAPLHGQRGERIEIAIFIFRPSEGFGGCS